MRILLRESRENPTKGTRNAVQMDTGNRVMCVHVRVRVRVRVHVHVRVRVPVRVPVHVCLSVCFCLS